MHLLQSVLVTSGGLPEGNARFLHYDGTSWKDATIGIDINANTVTGRISATSPVVVGIASDGTFGPAYFDEFPLARIQVTNTAFLDTAGAGISQASVDQTISIASTFTNQQPVPQKYTFIVMIVDQNGYAIDISWQEGTAASGQTVDLSSS